MPHAMTITRKTPYASAVLEAYPDLRFYVLVSRSNLERIPAAVFAPMTRPAFSALTNYDRRLTVERFVLATIADLGLAAARERLLEVLRSVAPDGAVKRPKITPPRAAAPAPTRVPAAGAVAQPSASGDHELRPSPSGYYVPCAHGCGQLLPARGPRAALRFVSGHRPKRKHHTPRAAA